MTNRAIDNTNQQVNKNEPAMTKNKALGMECRTKTTQQQQKYFLLLYIMMQKKGRMTVFYVNEKMVGTVARTND